MSDVFTRLSASLADRYTVVRELGAGGMATVYLAHDIKHERDVAIKVLHPDLGAALGADRFLSEIKTTAKLQHPHILPLLDSGDANGLLYYVMPLVTGETLRSRLEREKLLPIDDAIRIAREVADALGTAHALGIIHRDIKPENILLQGGHALVADFGIALAVQQAGGQRLTQTGLSLGTPQYMSPEQAMGERTIDLRSDIYALGAVTYEMLTGDPPFTGSTVQAIVAKVLTEKPASLIARRERVTVAIDHAVLTALEKLPADRFASTADFARALTDSSTHATAATARLTRVAEKSIGWRQRVAAPALIVATALAMATAWTTLRPHPVPPTARYRVMLADGQGLSGSPWSRLSVSSDGSKLVYVSDAETSTRLVLRIRDKLEAVVLPGTEGAINPTISPDGKRVAFMDRVSAGQIKVVSLEGGPPFTATDSLVGAPGVTWGYDGFIYYDRVGVGPLMRVPEDGGRAQSIGQLDSTKGEVQHSWPDALPNGKGVIMTVSRGGPGNMGSPTDEIAVLDVKTGMHRTLVRGIFARYAQSGHLVYVTADGALMAVPFDERRMMLAGDPVDLGENISVRIGGGAADLALSATGTFWYTAGQVGSSGTYEPVWVTREGVATRVAADLFGLIGDPALSSDGKQLAMSMHQLMSQIWIKDLTQGTLSKLSLNGKSNVGPAWSADSRRVAFVSDQNGQREIYQRLADGSQPEQRLLLNEKRPVSDIFLSKDGQWMIYTTRTVAGDRGDLFARRIGADSSIELAATAANERSPALSPDGRWLAFVSDEGGTAEVYVRPFPNTASGRWQISTQGGDEPLWSNSGKELFYRATGNTNAQMVMTIAPGATFVLGARRTMFPLGQFRTSQINRQYTISPDDQRFIMIRASESQRVDHLIAVENFFEVLKARVPRK